ncbi:hypothetical protein [Paenibacillus sp. JNUCC31]|nr:hypothetical protein [Paenibacillus sp. JNUCC-31]
MNEQGLVSTYTVSRAFANVKGNLSQIQWFHTDRGGELKIKRWMSFRDV